MNETSHELKQQKENEPRKATKALFKTEKENGARGRAQNYISADEFERHSKEQIAKIEAEMRKIGDNKDVKY